MCRGEVLRRCSYYLRDKHGRNPSGLPPLSRKPESFHLMPEHKAYPFGGLKPQLRLHPLSRAPIGCAVLRPERFRGGCSFGGVASTRSPAQSSAGCPTAVCPSLGPRRIRSQLSIDPELVKNGQAQRAAKFSALARQPCASTSSPASALAAARSFSASPAISNPITRSTVHSGCGRSIWVNVSPIDI